MRTAEEILNAYGYAKDNHAAFIEQMSLIVNDARKEVIEECAKIAKVIRHQPNPFVNQESALAQAQQDKVDKQSILSLIKELK